MIFRFPGHCSYLFASHCQSPTKLFHIQLRRSQQSDFPSIDKISMKITGTLIEIKANVIYVNGVPSNQSVINPQIQITKDASSITVTVDLVLVLAWNRHDRLELKLDERFRNKTCGLCGDFNGEPMNEFTVKGEMLTEIDFGKRQMLVDPAESCEDSLSEDMQEYPEENDFCISTVAKLEDCLERLESSPYVEACIKDSVNCQEPQNKLCMCSTITEYSKQCALTGGTPNNWRTPDACFIECPLNLEYQECGSACEDTCSNPDHSQICTEECNSVCSCPAGTVLDDINLSGCIDQDECSCTRRNKIYSPGSSFTTECLTCICEGGQWNCEKRPCPSLCSVEGSLFITTFDNVQYNFNGDCKYVLTQDCKDQTFVVEGSLKKNMGEGSETVLTSVYLRLNNKIIVIDSSGTVIIDGLSIRRFPYFEGMTIFKTSTSSIILYTTSGIQLQIDLSPIMMIYISLDPSYKGSTSGLCGNLNDYQSDDFKCKKGIKEATAAAGANSWKTSLSCPDIPISFKDPCALNTGVEQYALQWCKLLKDRKGPFAKCHSVINPNAFYKFCMHDTCSCKSSEVCMCATIEAYVRKCAIKDIYLKNWRNFICSDMAPVCPESMIYSDHITTCQPSCRCLNEPCAECNITFVPVDGCICKEGTYLDEQGICVPQIKCPCYYKNGIMQPDTTTFENGATCTCSLGKISCITESDSPDCNSPKFYFDCSSAPEGKPGFECQKRCQNLDVICDSVQCISGCMCPEDLVMNDDGDCIKEDECTCTRNGNSYKRGESITVGCNTCTCNRGKWICTQKEVIGTCVLYGEGHYITFDNRRYFFNGNCEYILAQDFCDSIGTFRVLTENVPCSTLGTTCSKSIKVYVGSCLLILSGNHYKETVCKIEEVPYKVREHGIFLVIDVGTGLILIWDKKTRITIKMTSNYKGKVCGLCGNYDDDRNNDFSTRSQVTVGTALEFVNSWKSSPKCPDANITPDACIINPKRKTAALKNCQIIISDVFAACHSQVDAIPYYDACVSDTCACNTGVDCDCICTSIAAFAEACNEACICIQWRTPDLCPLLCDDYNQKYEGCEWQYKPCGAPCIKTCRNPSGQCLHNITGLEGCYPNCPTDRPYLEENSMQCVPQCGCYDVDGNYYNIGEQLDICESCLNCTCTMQGTKCNYDPEACFCDYEGTIYLYKELIYQEKDSIGSCINVTCGLNGTLDKTYYTCPQTAYTTPFKSTTVTKSSDCVSEVCEWSSWYDASSPQLGPTNGDFESFENLRAKGFAVCDAPKQVRCRAKSFPTVPISNLGQSLVCSETLGLMCYNKDQTSGLCYNYEISILCCTKVYGCTSRPTIPSTLTQTVKPTTLPSTTKCLREVCKWSPWYDTSKPQQDAASGDFETFDNIRRQGYTICFTPRDIKCRAERFPFTPINQLNQIVQCNRLFGLTCYNNQQSFEPLCFNYQIQVLCCDFVPCTAESSSTEMPRTTTCMCSVNGRNFSPGDVVYSSMGTNGCVLYAICSNVCTINTFQGECVTTTTQRTSTSTTKTASTLTTSSSTTTRSTIRQRDPTEIPPIINIINCSNSVCEMTGNRSIITVLCPPVLVPVCIDGNPPAKVYDEDLCCFHYECRYCTGPDGQPKQSGETWLSGCNECFCSKTFTVQCSPLVCDTPMVAPCDKEGFELIVVPDPDNPCCPFEQCQCNPNLCLRPLNNCDPGFQFTVTFEEGDCCTSYGCVPKNVCVLNGLEYPPLSPVPADNDPCNLCNCTNEKDTGTQLNMVKCEPISCITDCQPGYIVIEQDGDCCGSCIQVACVVEKEDGTQEVHQPGEVWNDPDSNCTSYRCEQTGTTFTLGEENTICSPFVPEICEPGSIQMTPDGCCQTCQVNVTKPCSLQTMEVEVTYKSCSSLVELDYCEGPCMSSSMYVPSKQRLERKCSCCKEVDVRSKQVRLLCRDGTYINYNVSTVTKCDCVTANCVN
ncbi:mucin-2-like [Lissotriton helveticus]